MEQIILQNLPQSHSFFIALAFAHTLSLFHRLRKLNKTLDRLADTYLPKGDITLNSEPTGTWKEEDQGGDMVAFVDPRTKDIIECNDNLIEATGYQKSTLIGRDIFTLYPKHCQSNALTVFKTFLKNGKVIEQDLRLKIRGNGSIPVTLRISGSQDNRGRMRCTRFSFHNISKRKEVEDTLQEEKHSLKKHLLKRTKELRNTKQTVRKEVHQRQSAEVKVDRALQVLRRQHRTLRRLAGRLLSIQEDERRRLALDLHDTICQKLAMVAFQADALSQQLPSTKARITKELQALHQQLTEVNSEVRTVSHHLHPAVLEHLGLTKALESYIEEFVKQQGMRIAFSPRNVPKNLPINLALCLYRVTQECLGNILKHANVEEASVTLTGLTKSIRLSVLDRGKGFSKANLKAFQQGLGFISMVERTRLVKGKLNIESKVNQGTQVVLKIPYQ